MSYNCESAAKDISNFHHQKLGDQKQEIEGFKRAHLHAIGEDFKNHIQCPRCWEKIEEVKRCICDK